MAKVMAIKNYSGNNPGLRLVGAVIPGTRNFNTATTRLFNLVCVLGFVAGAYHLLGGTYNDLLQIKPLVAVLGLTFALSIREIGFQATLSGFVSAIVGTHKDEADFNLHIRRLARQGAHLLLMVNAIQAWDRVTVLGDFIRALNPAMYGYLYAVILGVVLPTPKHKAAARDNWMDRAMPIAFLAVAYFAYTRWI